MLETQQECNSGKERSKQTHSEILTNMTIGIAMQLHNPDGSVIMYINTDRPNLPKDGTFVGRQMCLLLLKSTKRDRDHKLVMWFVSIHPLQQSPTLQQHLKETTRATAQTRWSSMSKQQPTKIFIQVALQGIFFRMMLGDLTAKLLLLIEVMQLNPHILNLKYRLTFLSGTTPDLCWQLSHHE